MQQDEQDSTTLLLKLTKYLLQIDEMGTACKQT